MGQCWNRRYRRGYTLALNEGWGEMAENLTLSRQSTNQAKSSPSRFETSPRFPVIASSSGSPTRITGSLWEASSKSSNASTTLDAVGRSFGSCFQQVLICSHNISVNPCGGLLDGHSGRCPPKTLTTISSSLSSGNGVAPVKI